MTCWGLMKNQPHLPNFQAKILISTSHSSNQCELEQARAVEIV
jgi:hypothetical protein